MPTLEKPARLSLGEILVVTELAPWADRAVPYAVSLAQQHNAKMCLAHVVSQHPFHNVTAMPASGTFRHTWRDELQRVKARHVLLDSSDVALKLPYMINQREFDLVIVSARDRGAGALSLGNAARRLLGAANCPVLIFGPGTQESRPASSEPAAMVYATDFSPQSLAAAPHAFTWAMEYGARLSMVHVVEGIDEPQTESDRAALEEPYRTWLAELVPEDLALWCDVDHRVAFGTAGPAIVEAARERHADLIVLGLSGLDGTRVTSPGKTVSHLVREAPCPVFVVPGSMVMAADFETADDRESSEVLAAA